MQEINDSLVTIKQDDEKYQKLLSQYELSQKEYYYNLKRYNKGIISKLDLTQSEEVVFTMKKLITIQKMDNYINYIGLYKSTGAKL